MPTLPTITLAGVPLAALDETQCIAHILSALGAGRGGWVVTANLDILRRLRGDRAFAALCEDVSLIVADGRPLLWASRLQGQPLPGQIAGSSLVWTLSAAAATAGRSLYLLGGAPGAAAGAAERLRARHPNLRIAGWSCPPLGFEHDAGYLAALEADLSAARPDLVYVALGSPKQEQVIARLRACLPAAWWLGVGISFSYMAGQVRRAPPWAQRAGLEWLVRLGQEPRRLAKRYLVTGLPFGLWLLGAAVARRVISLPSAARNAARKKSPRAEARGRCELPFE